MKQIIAFSRATIAGLVFVLTFGLTLAVAQNPDSQAVKNIVLVHGAWADGSSWSKVIPRLQAEGFHVTAVQLSLSSLETDVAITKRAIALENGPVLLVAHSYGGVVISEAGNDPKVTGLVYVAAFAPDAGESAFSLGERFPPTPVTSEIIADQLGFLKLTPNGILKDFAPDLAEREKRTMISTQGPTSVAVLSATVEHPAWRNKPTWYIVAEHDRIIAPELERVMSARMNALTIEVRSCHVVMLDHPDAVVKLIQLATSK